MRPIPARTSGCGERVLEPLRAFESSFELLSLRSKPRPTLTPTAAADPCSSSEPRAPPPAAEAEAEGGLGAPHGSAWLRSAPGLLLLEFHPAVESLKQPVTRWQVAGGSLYADDSSAEPRQALALGGREPLPPEVISDRVHSSTE